MNKPKIVCLCGSTRFSEAFQLANLRETLAGNIVLTIGCDMRSDADLFAHYSELEMKQIKEQLDELHKRKIDLADEVYILNVGGYIGESTRSELEYAIANHKPVRYLETPEKCVEPDVFSCNRVEGTCKQCIVNNYNEDDEDDFEQCSECDGHDACRDFGCAIKHGLGHMVQTDL